MSEILGEIRDSFKGGSSLTRLIYINLFVFLALKILYVVYFLSGNEFLLYNWLMLPSDLATLIHRP